MVNKNELLIKNIDIYPKINNIKEYIIVLTTYKENRKFFIDIDKFTAEAIIFLKNKKTIFLTNENTNKIPTEYILLGTYFKILIEHKLNIKKIILSITPEDSSSKIFINNKKFDVTKNVALILSMQFKSKTYIKEESFIFNKNPFFENEIKNFDKVKKYTFTFSLLGNYSQEFLSFLRNYAEKQNDIDLLFIIDSLLKNNLKKQVIDDKDFF